MAVLNLGFRPFFLGAGLMAVLSIAIWAAFYRFGYALPVAGMTPFQWHAHEMIYGYSLAVIAGFLLTATKNWTNIQTLHGKPLLALLLVWLAARVCLLLGTNWLAFTLDMLFIIALSSALAVPIVQAKQWRQMAILSKLVVLCIFNALFYLGVLGISESGIYLGIYGGFYLLIGLIMMMGRRVVPMFIENGVAEDVKLTNHKWLDITSLVAFLVFFIAELSQALPLIASLSALLLGLVNIIRLLGWHTPGLWKKPLLWCLYIALWSISLGFLAFFLAYSVGLSKFIAIHFLAYGGIGMITLGMMARVTLGHGGRNVHQSPMVITLALSALVVGLLLRVVLPVMLPAHYTTWLLGAMLCWIIAFGLFLAYFFPILVKPRIDGRPG